MCSSYASPLYLSLSPSSTLSLPLPLTVTHFDKIFARLPTHVLRVLPACCRRVASSSAAFDLLRLASCFPPPLSLSLPLSFMNLCLAYMPQSTTYSIIIHSDMLLLFLPTVINQGKQEVDARQMSFTAI